MKHMLAAGLLAVASAAVFPQTPAGSTQGAPPQTEMRQTSPASVQNAGQPQGQQTLTGCLTAADNVYTLTVLEDAGAPGSTATTMGYTLAPGSGVDLKPFVNKRVTIKGTDAGPGMQNSAGVVPSPPPAPSATGTSGSAKPTAETTAKARINAKTLNVTSAQEATGSCGA